MGLKWELYRILAERPFATSMTPEERPELAKRAAQARWHDSKIV